MSEITPVGRDRQELADWVELVALSRGAALGADGIQALGVRYGLGDADIAMALGTMARRAELLGPAYPFRIANGVAARRAAASTPWTAMLLLSPGSPARSSVPLAEAAMHLEQLTAAALGQFFGGATEVARFGWPGDLGRPPEFPEAVRWLADKMGTEIGTAYRPPYRKDGGVDVVAWRPFPDRRSGFPVLLTQCTLEQDYAHKAGDVDTRVWSGWLRLDVDPMTALAVPTVVASGEAWNALAARVVVLDRVRLVSLLAQVESHERLEAPLAWAETAVEAMRAP